MPRSYTAVGSLINTIHEENQSINPPKRDYLESNISNGNFRNNNSYYKGSKPFNSAQNLSGGNRYKKEKELIQEEIVKPQFINSQLNDDVHFADLKQDDDLFYKKMQKLQIKEENKKEEKVEEEKPKSEEQPEIEQIEQKEEPYDDNNEYYTSQTEGNYYNNNYTQRYRNNYYYNQRGNYNGYNNYNSNYRYNSYRRNYNDDYQNEEDLIAQTLGNEEKEENYYEKKENKVNKKKKIRPPKEDKVESKNTSGGPVIIKLDTVSIFI